MKSVPLRRIADVNPATPEFDRLGPDDEVTFMPLETVWADDRVDFSRRATKAAVATGYTRFRHRDVLVPKVTPTFQAGRTTVAQLATAAGAGTTELHVIRARPDVSDPRFLAYVCRSKPFLDEGVSAFQGVAGLQRVPDEYLRAFAVADLPLDEQRRIADFLDTETARLDALVNARARQADEVATRVQAELDALFATPGFEQTRLKYLLQRRICYGVLVPRFVSDDGVRLIRVNDLTSLRERAASLVQIEREQSAEYRRTLVAEGDLLVSVVGSVGRSAVVPAEARGANLARAVARLSPVPEATARLLWCWMQSSDFRRQVTLATGGDTAQPTLNVGDLGNFELRLPSTKVERDALERRASAALAVRDAVVAACARQLEVILERRQALITAAVTGGLDVTTVGATRDGATKLGHHGLGLITRPADPSMGEAGATVRIRTQVTRRDSGEADDGPTS